MPKIPTYDQLGQRVKDVSPQIGLRADPGMVNSQLAAADFYAKAQDVAYNFSMAEQAENTKAAKSEIKALYNDQSSEVIRNSKKRDTAGAQSELDAFNKMFEKEYYNKGLNKNQVKEIKTEMNLYQSSKMQNHKTLSFDRGRDYNSTKHNEYINSLTNEITRLPIGNAARKAMEQELRETHATAILNGETANLDSKTFEDSLAKIEISDFTLLSNNASSLEEISNLQSDLKNKTYSPGLTIKIDALLDQNKTRVENEIGDALVREILFKSPTYFTDEGLFTKNMEELKNKTSLEIVNSDGKTVTINPSKLPTRILESVISKAKTRKTEELSNEINDISVTLNQRVQEISLKNLSVMLTNMDATGKDRLYKGITNNAHREKIKQIIEVEKAEKAKRAIDGLLQITDNIKSDLRNDGKISEANKVNAEKVIDTLILAGEDGKAYKFRMTMESEIEASGAFQSIKFSSNTATKSKLNELSLKFNQSGSFKDQSILTSFSAQVAARDAAINKDFIEYYISQNKGEEITTKKMVELQKGMGISEKNIRIHTDTEMKKIFSDYDSKTNPSEAANYLKELIETSRREGYAKYLVPHMMKNGFTQYENLTMINPLSPINNTFLLAKKATKEQIAATTDSADHKLINQGINRKFNLFRESVAGQALYGSVLQGNNRGGSIDAIEMAIAKTARYIKSTNNALTNEEVEDRAMSIITDSYEIRSVNGGAYRMPNEKVMQQDHSRVDSQLSKIISDKVFLKGIVKVPTGSTPETYLNQASGGLRWVTNENETGVFLINANANGSQVQDKNTDKRIEYTWEQLITKGIASELTEEQKRDIEITGFTKEDTENLTSDQIKELRLEKARKKYLPGAAYEETARENLLRYSDLNKLNIEKSQERQKLKNQRLIDLAGDN